MDLRGYRTLIFINSIIVLGSMPSFYSSTRNGYTLIMPLTDGGTQSPLNVSPILAEQWCSSINSTLPRITDETEHKFIVDFIRNATQNYKFDETHSIFVNNIYHATGNWNWVNCQTSQGFTINRVSQTDGEHRYYGYLWTNNYRINYSPPLKPRSYYICEKSAHLRHSNYCDLKHDNRCYWKRNVASTWHKARNDCLNERGDLASFENLYENALKVSLQNLSLNEGERYWIGIRKGVWQWNDTGIDFEMKYSDWKPNHPSNYNAKCLCLDKSKLYQWFECQCDKEYPFICKRYDTYDALALQSKCKIQNVDSTQTSTLNPLPNGQQPITETVRLALVLGSCGIIVVVIVLIVAAVIIWKHRNRTMNSCCRKTSEAETSATVNGIPIYAEINGGEDTRNRSESTTTYATVQPTQRTNNEPPTVYAELDLLPKA